jgi:pyruvate kinase
MAISFNKTKIIATVGPASASTERLRALIREGVDVFRLNFSHGSHEDHLQVINRVRELNMKHGTNVCLLQDLQGPKIRIGEVMNGEVLLKRGQRVRVVCRNQISTAEVLATEYAELARDVRPGDAIMIDDGKVELRVLETDQDMEVLTEVIYGGPVRTRKGMNLPDTKVSAPSLTDKDLYDLRFGLEQGVEWVALSFVRTVDDILAIKQIIRESGKFTRVVAKIEKPQAIKNLDAIIQASDAIMVARGDLGVEIGMEEVPMVQKTIASKANRYGKPVIIATQMMESMITSPRPTRAETNDVANAVIDGADALMLSAETAVGEFPIETIRSMTRTIERVERQADLYYRNFHFDHKSPTFYSDSVVGAACYLARDTDAAAIIGMTKSGYTAFQLAKYRPKAHIFIFTDNRLALNTLNLVWGIRAFYYDKFTSTDETISDIREILIQKKLIRPGDVYINTASIPIAEKKKTNMVKLSIA